MALKRRTIFQVLALAVALLVLAFVVSRGGALQKPTAVPEPTPDPAATTSRNAPSPAANAPSPTAGASSEPDYMIMGPATKADPHTVRRAVESLSEPAPTTTKAPPAAPSATEKP